MIEIGIGLVAFALGAFFGVRLLPKVSPRLHRKMKGW